MGDSFKKVQTGDKLRIPAAAYNAFIDSALDLRARQQNQGQTPQAAYRTSGIVLVKNASGSDQDRFAVLGVDGPIYTPEDNLESFKNKVALVGVVPTVQNHYGRFVVLLEPLKAGAIGMAYAAGVCPVRIDLPDETVDYPYADIDDGETANLEARRAGAAAILWREGGTGVQWALVRLGAGFRGVTKTQTLLTGLSLNGTDLVATAVEMEIQDGLVVDIRDLDDITIEGTECPQEEEA